MSVPSDDCIERTQQELNAGLRKKILAMRKVACLADELLKEIEAIIKAKKLDQNTAYHQA